MESLFSEDLHKPKFSSTFVQNHLQQFSFNPEQTAFIQSPLENSKLIGIPGGGKTLSILGKILYHFIQQDFQNSSEYILLTFSRKTNIEFLHKSFQYLQQDSELFFHRKNVCTLHSLASRIHQEYHMEEEQGSQDTIIISTFHHIQQNPSILCEMEELKYLKVIFVDEAQDLSKIQYDFLLLLQETFQIPMIMIGDPNQNIYQFQKGNDAFLLNHVGKTYHLVLNYRSNPSLLPFINFFRPWKEVTPNMKSGKIFRENEHMKPSIFVGSIEEILEDISKNISQSSYPRENMAVIGPVKKSKPIYESYKNIGLSLFVNHFQKKNISFKKHFEESSEDYPSSSDMETSHKDEGSVNLYTIHGAKGLEFDEVYLINFHTTTFGVVPTEEKYKEFKYLWYVGLSRAKYKMRIYIEEKKTPWYELKMCPTNYYRNENKMIRFPHKLEYNQEIEPFEYELSQILRNKMYFDEEVHYQMQSFFKYKTKKEVIYSMENMEEVQSYKEYQKIYHHFFQHLFIFYHSFYQNKIPEFITRIQDILANMIVIPKKYMNGYKDFRIRYPNMMKEALHFGKVYENKNKFKRNEELLFQYLYDQFEGDLNRIFFMVYENDINHFPKQEIEESILFLELWITERNEKEKQFMEKHHILHLFRVTLFLYQFHEETSYLWKYDFKEEIVSLQPYIQKIREYAESMKEIINVKYFHKIQHPYLPLYGEADLYMEDEQGKRKIVFMKFHKNIMKRHIYEMFLLGHMKQIDWKDIEMEVWNFHSGEKIKYSLTLTDLQPFTFLRILSTALKKKLENMIFMYDVEIIGEEGDKIDIVQISIEDYIYQYPLLDSYVLPEKMQHINQYYNRDLLIQKNILIDTLQEEIQTIFDSCNMPIFISHNANVYDQVILNQNGMFLKRNLFRLIDTRQLWKHYMNPQIADMEIMDIFESIFGYVLDETKCSDQIQMIRMVMDYFHITNEQLYHLAA